jgi:hypothetical protein
MDLVVIVAVMAVAATIVDEAGVAAAAMTEKVQMAGAIAVIAAVSQATGFGNVGASSPLKRMGRPMRPKRRRPVYSSPSLTPLGCQIRATPSMAAVT